LTSNKSYIIKDYMDSFSPWDI